MRKAVYAAMLVLAFLMMSLSGCGRQNDTIVDDTIGVEITGTWQTASMMLSGDGDIAPEHYVQFTDSKINYGHMKDCTSQQKLDTKKKNLRQKRMRNQPAAI